MTWNGSITVRDMLIVVDVQNDFCPGGALAVPDGDEVIPIINRIASLFPHVILTQDWHPRDHISFASNHEKAEAFRTIVLDYGEQMLWPDHCVQDSHGAAFHVGLHVPGAELILRKGFRRSVDSYSVLYENDRVTPTGLAGYLRQRGFERVLLAGLTLDYCVRFSAEDARRDGFDVVVVEDACRSISARSRVEALQSFSERKIPLILSDDLG